MGYLLVGVFVVVGGGGLVYWLVRSNKQAGPVSNPGTPQGAPQPVDPLPADSYPIFAHFNQYNQGGLAICLQACAALAVDIARNGFVGPSPFTPERLDRCIEEGVQRHGTGDMAAEFAEIIQERGFMLLNPAFEGSDTPELLRDKRAIRDTLSNNPSRLTLLKNGPEAWLIIYRGFPTRVYYVFDSHGKPRLYGGNKNAYITRFFSASEVANYIWGENTLKALLESDEDIPDHQLQHAGVYCYKIRMPRQGLP